MIYDDFLIFKLDINWKIELRQKIKCAQTLLLYSSVIYYKLQTGFNVFKFKRDKGENKEII